MKGVILSALKLVLIGSLLVGGLLFVGAETIAKKIFSKSELGMVIRLLTLSLPFFALMEVSVFSIQAIQTLKYKVFVKEFFLQASNLAAVVILFSVGLQIEGALYAYILSAVLSALLGIYFLKRTFPDIKNRGIKAVSALKSLIRFSVPVVGMNLFSFGMIWTDTLMVGYLMATKDVGIYNAGARAAMLISLILFSFSAIFMPMTSDLYRRGEMTKLEGLFKTVTKWIFAVSFPACLLMAILSKQIMALFGPEFTSGMPCLLILLLAQMINTSTGPVGNFLIMSGKRNVVFWDMALFFCLNVLLSYSLILKYGVVGAAISTLVSIALLNIAFLIELYYFHKIHPYDLKFVKPLLAGLLASLMGLLALSFTFGNKGIFVFPLTTFIFILCYVIFLLILGFDEEDKIILQTVLRRLWPTRT